MKHCVLIVILISTCFALQAQSSQQKVQGEAEVIVNIKKKLAAAKSDTTRSLLMGSLGLGYEGINTDSSLKYGKASLQLAERTGYPHFISRALAGLSGIFRQQGKFVEALNVLYKALNIAQQHDLKNDIARSYRRLGAVYFELENYTKAVEFDRAALVIDDGLQLKSNQIDHVFLADAFVRLNKPDSALTHSTMPKDTLEAIKTQFYGTLGNIYLKLGNNTAANVFYHKCYDSSLAKNDFGDAATACNGLTEMYLKLNNLDSAVYFAKEGFAFGQKASFKKEEMNAAGALAKIYDSTQPALALAYLKMADAAKESLYGVSTIEAIQNQISQEQARQKELEDAKLSYQNRLRWYGALAAFAGLLAIAFILYRNNKQKEKANVLLQHQKEKIESTLSELKSTQAQLIQSEKMASLGELTAGIAHEIQNPLNFVNNFSEVSNELIDEMNVELDKGEIEEAKAIAADVKQNLEKINHHGKRADAIVKGMLQHSQSSSGKKEPTDINALCDEYLRLSYHGLRAKDKSFNATIKTDFDKSIGKINIIPQDIGRVILNLFTNAFYVVNEKKKQQPEGYEPTVSVSTKKINDNVEITVSDNGNGIPQKIIDKIFQPFFTTKPTGQGTGLGLSLSYDIIKTHGGEIKVESKESEGTTFTIQLPTT
ncbi:MAG TPA: ATP-binding protein [Chitinophagaceae bacterium]|nr:ATP-binding protein [Chitinophagaceae bacterium]